MSDAWFFALWSAAIASWFGYIVVFAATNDSWPPPERTPPRIWVLCILVLALLIYVAWP